MQELSKPLDDLKAAVAALTEVVGRLSERAVIAQQIELTTQDGSKDLTSPAAQLVIVNNSGQALTLGDEDDPAARYRFSIAAGATYVTPRYEASRLKWNFAAPPAAPYAIVYAYSDSPFAPGYVRDVTVSGTATISGTVEPGRVSSASQTVVNVTAASTSILAANAARKRFWLQNTGANPVAIRLGSPAVFTDHHLLPANNGVNSVFEETLYTGQVTGICGPALSTTVRVIEL